MSLAHSNWVHVAKETRVGFGSFIINIFFLFPNLLSNLEWKPYVFMCFSSLRYTFRHTVLTLWCVTFNLRRTTWITRFLFNFRLKFVNATLLSSLPHYIPAYEFDIVCVNETWNATVYQQEFIQILPHHIPPSAPSNHQKLSVDIYTLESMALSHVRRDMPVLTDWIASERWVALKKLI